MYLSWPISDLVSSLGNNASFVKTISRHAYPQSACGGASTNLQDLMTHPSVLRNCTLKKILDLNDYRLSRGIVSFAEGYKSEIAVVHNISKRYFLGETNSGASYKDRVCYSKLMTSEHSHLRGRRNISDIWCRFMGHGLCAPSSVKRRRETILSPRNNR